MNGLGSQHLRQGDASLGVGDGQHLQDPRQLTLTPVGLGALSLCSLCVGDHAH